ncbi:MAG: hypothetical protein IKL10_07925 [Clostridia bacterium]|nr:hypothetical protein [Clostridia bacterium]
MREFIFGTDWWTDCDDLAAMRILLRAHKKGEIKLLGVGINACMEHSAPSVEGFMNLEGVNVIPLGIDLEGTDFEGTHLKYQKNLAPFAVNYKKNEDAEDAVRLYRRLLSESDGNVEIVEVGFLQVIANVLLSGGDDISPKSGLELMREKVKKIWVMAGKWDEEGGKEHNFCNNCRSREGAETFCRLCPVPVTFLGFEVGVNIISGNELLYDDFLYKAFCDHGSKNGRSSWDPLTALLALMGDEETAGYDTVSGKAFVDAKTGRNYFTEDKLGLHKYVKLKYEEKYYAYKINELIN